MNNEIGRSTSSCSGRIYRGDSGMGLRAGSSPREGASGCGVMVPLRDTEAMMWCVLHSAAHTVPQIPNEPPSGGSTHWLKEVTSIGCLGLYSPKCLEEEKSSEGRRIKLRAPTDSRDRPGYHDSKAVTGRPASTARLSSTWPPAPTAALLQKTTMEPERPTVVLVERLPARALTPTKLRPQIF